MDYNVRFPPEITKSDQSLCDTKIIILLGCLYHLQILRQGSRGQVHHAKEATVAEKGSGAADQESEAVAAL